MTIIDNIRSFWKNYWTLSLWTILIGIPLGLLIGISGYLYIKYFEPKPIGEKYGYYIKPGNVYEPVYFYKTKKQAIKAIDHYKANNTIGDIISDYKSPPIIFPGQKILIIRYTKDSSIVGVRRIINGIHNKQVIERGWMPSFVLHDTIDSNKLILNQK